jgi:hypothetical protein
VLNEKSRPIERRLCAARDRGIGLDTGTVEAAAGRIIRAAMDKDYFVEIYFFHCPNAERWRWERRILHYLNWQKWVPHA